MTWAPLRSRLPVVLTVEEVTAVLERLAGTCRLTGTLLYGSGLRLLECLTLPAHAPAKGFRAWVARADECLERALQRAVDLAPVAAATAAGSGQPGRDSPRIARQR
jgi:hypothetical protein